MGWAAVSSARTGVSFTWCVPLVLLIPYTTVVYSVVGCTSWTYPVKLTMSQDAKHVTRYVNRISYPTHSFQNNTVK